MGGVFMRQRQSLTRREALFRMGGGFGGLALASLFAEAARGDPPLPASRPHDIAERAPHFAPRARAVIQLFMHGGPSHIDLLDPKPLLERYNGQPPPAQVADDERITGNLLKSPFRFQRHGQSGLEFSETLPHIGRHADKIAVIRSMFTEHRNHEQALWMMHTGMIVAGRPSARRLGCVWAGNRKSEPAGVRRPCPILEGCPSMASATGRADGCRRFIRAWQFRSEGMPVLNLQATRRHGRNRHGRTSGSNLLARVESTQPIAISRPDELELDARIANFEMAARMQLSAGDALDLSNKKLKRRSGMYGLDQSRRRDPYGYSLPDGAPAGRTRRPLRAAFHVRPTLGHPWQQCRPDPQLLSIRPTFPSQDCLPISPSAACSIQHARLLGRRIRTHSRCPGIAMDETTIPTDSASGSQAAASGAAKSYGATDDFGYRAVVNRTSVADLHATMLHQLGLDYRRLAFHRHGRDERLTDVAEPRLLRELIG